MRDVFEEIFAHQPLDPTEAARRSMRPKLRRRFYQRATVEDDGAIVLDGKIHLLGGRDVRSVEWHEIYDPSTNKYTTLSGMRGSTATQPYVGQRDHMGVALVDG